MISVRLCQFEIDICLSIYLGMFTMALYIMIFDFPFFLGSQGQVPPSVSHRQTEVLHKRGAGVEEKGEEVSLSECRHLESR